jgi:hypothetical protein
MTRNGVVGRSDLGVEDFGQALDLLDVEHGVALHVGDFERDIFAGLQIPLGARDGVGVDHKRTFLAFADMAVKLGGLAVGHPDWSYKILAQGRHPERQDVDTGIGLPVVAQRPRDASGGMLSAPWLHSGADSFLKMPDDLGRDAAVNVFPFGRVWHGLLLKNNFFLRETRDGSEAFSGADQSRARQCPAFIADP